METTPMEKTNKQRNGSAESPKKRAKTSVLSTPLEVLRRHDLRSALTDAIRDEDKVKLDLWLNLAIKQREHGITFDSSVYHFKDTPANMPDLTAENIFIVHIIVMAIKFGRVKTFKLYYWYLTTKWNYTKAPMMTDCDAMGIVLYYALLYQNMRILKWARKKMMMREAFRDKKNRDVLLGVCDGPQLNNLICKAIDERYCGLLRYIFDDLRITWAPGISHPQYAQMLLIGRALSTGSKLIIELIKELTLPIPQCSRDDISNLQFDAVEFSHRLGKASTDQIAYVMDAYQESVVIQPSIYYDAVANADLVKVQRLSKHVGTFGEDHNALLGDLKDFSRSYHFPMFETSMSTRLEVIEGIWGQVLLSGSTKMFHAVNDLFGNHVPCLRLISILRTIVHHPDKPNPEVLSLMVPSAEDAVRDDWKYGEADDKKDHRYVVLKYYIDRAFTLTMEVHNYGVANWILRAFDSIIWHS